MFRFNLLNSRFIMQSSRWSRLRPPRLCSLTIPRSDRATLVKSVDRHKQEYILAWNRSLKTYVYKKWLKINERQD